MHAKGVYDTSCTKDQINLYRNGERLLLNILINAPQVSDPLPLEEKMTSHVKLRRERIGLIDYETQIKGNIIC